MEILIGIISVNIGKMLNRGIVESWNRGTVE